MGYRIHFSPIYQVNYGGGHFSHHTAELNRLLYEHSEDISYEGEDIECAERISVPRADLANLIGWISSNRDDFSQWLKKYQFDCNPDEFICIICEWISQSDPRNDYVVLTWF